MKGRSERDVDLRGKYRGKHFFSGGDHVFYFVWIVSFTTYAHIPHMH